MKRHRLVCRSASTRPTPIYRKREFIRTIRIFSAEDDGVLADGLTRSLCQSGYATRLCDERRGGGFGVVDAGFRFPDPRSEATEGEQLGSATPFVRQEFAVAGADPDRRRLA